MNRILLVDDTEDNRDMLARRLRRRGFEIFEATDGTEACRLATELLPDLILMDMQMPVMDGYEATRVIKADAATAAIPIIGLTAYAMAGDRDRVLAAGCDEYQSKPVDMESLVGQISKLLSR